MGDWAVWVTLLRGLARGSGVLGADASRKRLLERFDGLRGGPPKGLRVYAARVADYREPAEPVITRYTLALHGDARVVLGPDKQPRGLDMGTGSLSAAETIGLGKVALLVLGRTYHSGPDHLPRLDRAAAQVGLDLVWPLGNSLPPLEPTSISVTDLSRLFTVSPIGTDLSLMPEVLQRLLG